MKRTQKTSTFLFTLLFCLSAMTWAPSTAKADPPTWGEMLITIGRSGGQWILDWPSRTIIAGAIRMSFDHPDFLKLMAQLTANGWKPFVVGAPTAGASGAAGGTAGGVLTTVILPAIIVVEAVVLTGEIVFLIWDGTKYVYYIWGTGDPIPGKDTAPIVPMPSGNRPPDAPPVFQTPLATP